MPKWPSLPEMSPYKVNIDFSKPLQAARVKIGPSGANYASFTAKPGSHQVRSTLQMTPLLPPVPLFLLMQKLCASAQTILFAPCDVTQVYYRV